MELTRTFSQLNRGDAALAGGKGASLGEMSQAGIPVPPGFVVLADSFEQFVKGTDLDVEIDSILHTVNHQEIHTVEDASAKIQALIKAAAMPADIAADIKKQFKTLDTQYVAVRSSATAEDSSEAAWAGQLDSFLNTTEENLLEKVQHCWASLFTPRAIFYRFEKELHKQKISVAVVVQKMVNSEVSGIAFSVHPVTEDHNQLIIEAGFGLGEAIVSGQITPDSYVIEKDPRRIIDTNIATQERGLYRVEGGGNEWQTIVEPKASSQVLTEAQIFELSEIILGIEKHYGFPCDIEWAHEAGKFYIVQSRPITTLTSIPPDPKAGLTTEGVTTETGDPLSDVSKWRFWGRWVFSVFANGPWNDYSKSPAFKKLKLPAEFKGDAVNIDGYVYALEADHQLFQTFAVDKFNHDRSWFDNYFAVCQEAIDQANQLIEHNDIAGAIEVYTDIACCSMLIHFCDKALEPIIPEFIVRSGISSDEFTKVVVPYQPTLIMQYKTALRTLTPDSFDQFLKEYQWVGANYMVGNRLTKAEILHDQATLEPDLAEKAFDLTTVSPDVAEEIIILQKLIYYRSLNAETINKLVNTHWEALDALAARYGKTRDDLDLLTPPEILNLLGGKDLPADFNQRSKRNGLSCINRDFKLYFGKDLEEILKVFEHRVTAGQKTITGTPAFKGKVQGIVKIIQEVSDLQKLNEGDIIIANETTPEYIIGMKKAAAFVTNQGGITSHAAIVARELKKPCIIGTKIATKVLKDGDLVEVDADRGVVTLLESKGVLDQLGVADKSSWVEVGRWIMPVLPYPFFSHWHTTKVVREATPELNFHPIFSIDGYAFMYKKDVENIYSYLVEGYKANRLGELAKRLDTLGRDIFPKLRTELTQHDSHNVQTIDELLLHYQEFVGFWSAASYLGDQLSQIAKDVGYVSTEAALFAQVHPHLRDTWIEEESKTMIKLAEKFVLKNGEAAVTSVPELVAKDKELQADIDQYVQDFAWSRISKWIGEPITAAYAYERLAEEVKNSREGNHIESKRVVGDESKLDGIIYLSVAVAYWRAESAKMEMLMAYHLRGLLQTIGEHNNLDYQQVLSLTPSELSTTIKDGALKISNKEAVLKRGREFFSVITDKGEEIVLTPSDAEYATLKDMYVNTLEEGYTADVLHGIGASPGFVTGKVRVINSAHQFDTFQKDEILVAPETTPSFVPLMRLAAAILTGRGGITSHAAIVSRELRKPCIIAIKDVTKILKDGDMVEVDANKGVVTILK